VKVIRLQVPHSRRQKAYYLLPSVITDQWHSCFAYICRSPRNAASLAFGTCPAADWKRQLSRPWKTGLQDNIH